MVVRREKMGGLGFVLSLGGLVVLLIEIGRAHV